MPKLPFREAEATSISSKVPDGFEIKISRLEELMAECSDVVMDKEVMENPTERTKRFSYTVDNIMKIIIMEIMRHNS